MADITWITVFFPTLLIFRYHLPLTSELSPFLAYAFCKQAFQWHILIAIQPSIENFLFSWPFMQSCEVIQTFFY